jgi:type II secretory pathway pseudopilin PulG
MKKENGITLAALVVTIIVILILASISINYGYDSINEGKNNILVSELQMVEQAVAEQYIQAIELKLDETLYTNESNKPSIYVGTLIHFDDLETYKPEGITYISADLKTERISEDKIAYSEFYYLLTSDDLENLKIESNGGGEYTYVVNYSTGEVYNYTKKKTSGSDSEVLYYAGKKDSQLLNKETDTTSFTE